MQEVDEIRNVGPNVRAKFTDDEVRALLGLKGGALDVGRAGLDVRGTYENPAGDSAPGSLRHHRVYCEKNFTLTAIDEPAARRALISFMRPAMKQE